MAHLWLQNANEAKARKCERLNRTQLAPASRVDAQIAIHVESGTTCRSSACFGPAKRPRNKGRRAIRGMRCVARSGGTSAGRQMAVILGRVAGVPPGETRCVSQFRAACCHFQFQYWELYQIWPPWRNKVDASRRAEKCRSLRVKVEVGVSGCA